MAKDLNCCAFVGRATRDAEIRTSSSGLIVCKFSMALNGYKKDDVSFLNFVIFGTFANAIGKYITKGKRLAIRAEAKQSTWLDKETQKNRSAIEFIVQDLTLLDGGTEAKQTEAIFETTKNFEDDIPF